MESRPSLLFSILLFFSVLLSSTLASPVGQRPSSLAGRIAEELNGALALRRESLDAQRRDVVAPPITSPDASSVWPVGSTQVVTWDTSDLPPDEQITNKIGRVLLGFDSGDSLNLDIDHPLAQGFNIRDGKVSVVVPNVPPRKDYLIVLMGNSGNTSPSFAITAISNGGSASSSSSTQTSPTPTSTPNVAPITASPNPVTTTSTPAVLSPTTITDPIPITGTTITGGDPNADTTFPTSFTEASNPPQTTAANQSAGDQSPLTNASLRQMDPRSCWTMLIGLVAGAAMVL